MRLGITGVPGSGKTTLTNLIGTNTNLAVLQEVENVVLREMGYEHLTHLVEAKGVPGLIENFFLSLDRKKEFETVSSHFVCDKTVFDYGARWFARMWKEATPQEHEKVRQAMADYARQGIYDKIIHLPFHPERALSGNDHRTQDMNLLYKRDLVLRGLFSHYGVKVEEYEFDFRDSPLKVLNDLGLSEFAKVSA